MNFAESFQHEFANEEATTRRFLERVPADRLDWKPHEKSLSVGQLALHLAATPGQVITMVREDESPAPDFSAPFPAPANLDEILAAHDESTKTVNRILPEIDDARMAETWRAMMGDREVMSMPRAAFIRSVMLNHCYHHRGQLGVYLRLLGVAVPFAYGPSGDEMPDFIREAMAAGA